MHAITSTGGGRITAVRQDTAPAFFVQRGELGYELEYTEQNSNEEGRS